MFFIVWYTVELHTKFHYRLQGIQILIEKVDMGKL